jgi:hypothetical protein
MIEVHTENNKTYVLRDDGYRIWARELGSSSEQCVFEYKHSEMDDAHLIVRELLNGRVKI